MFKNIIYLSGKLLRVSTSSGLKVWRGFTDMATDSKAPRLIQKIGTHSGVFHCDEALACYMLKQLPLYKDAEVIRTRDQTVLDTCDIVVDVGGVYDPTSNRYDHHQREFEETLSSVRPDLTQSSQIKLSSAGLVYAHFGLDVLKSILEQKNLSISSPNLSKIFMYVYESFVEEVDAIDNGVPMYSEGTPRYRINSHLSARVHLLNPEWNEPEPESNDTLFWKAVNLTGSEFETKVLEAATVWWPAREIVLKAIESRKTVHDLGEIIILGERCPWKEHLFALEKELGISNEIKFVLFHDRTDSWRVQGIPLQPDSFICRVFLHKNWQGVRDEKLSEISGIPDAVFCHATGFIGGCKSKSGVLEMAVKSLKAAALPDIE